MPGLPKSEVNRPSGPGAVDVNERARQAQAALEQKRAEEEPEEYREEPRGEESPPEPPKKTSPRERWLARIAEVKLSEEDAATICSEQLDPGYSQREYTRMGGKLIVTLRTRDAAHRTRLRFALDRLATPTQVVYNETVLYQCLVSSIVSIKMPTRTITFRHANPGDDIETVEKMYRDRAAAVDNLGESLLGICFKLVSEFDTMIEAAMSEGATEGF